MVMVMLMMMMMMMTMMMTMQSDCCNCFRCGQYMDEPRADPKLLGACAAVLLL